jgi:hypothetical protein
MACFLITVAGAIVTTAAERMAESKEHGELAHKNVIHEMDADPGASPRIPLSRKLKWLSNLLWGGSFLLAFEHVWHGEVVPWFPFLTAAANPNDTAAMFHEIVTVGVSMLVFVTLVWGGMVLVTNIMATRIFRDEAAINSGEVA